MNKERIGIFLEELRMEQDYTKEYLSKTCGVTVQDVTNWELGIELPTIEVFLILSNLYHISIDDIISGRNKGKTRKEKIGNVIMLVLSFVTLLSFISPLFMIGESYQAATELTLLLLIIIGLIVYLGMILLKFTESNIQSRYIIGIGNIALMVLAYYIFSNMWNSETIMYLIMVLSGVNIVICLIDIYLKSKGREFESDSTIIRRMIALVTVIPYFYIFVSILIQFFTYNEWFEDISFLIWIILLGVYTFSYAFLGREFYLSRAKTMIYLAIPPLSYVFSISIATFVTKQVNFDDYWILILVFLIMLLPEVFVNMDLIVRFIKRDILKLDK